MMIKRVCALAVVSTTLFAASDGAILSYIGQSIKANPGVVLKGSKVVSRQSVPGFSSWEAVRISYEVSVTRQGRTNEVKMSDFVFSNGDVITADLFDTKHNTSFKALVMPTPTSTDYRADRLIAGSSHATHKIVVFSDPLCPFCKEFMTDAISVAKKAPTKFAVYYYHFPLPTIHPQSPWLIRAIVAAEELGVKDVAYKVYSTNFEFKSASVDEILEAFNKTLGTKVTKEHLLSAKVNDHITYDAKRAEELMIKGTPAVFIDGKADPKRERFEIYQKEVK